MPLEPATPAWLRFARLFAPMAYLGALAVACCFASVTPWLLIVLLVAGVALLNGSGYGLPWSANIASALARLHERGVYDLLAATPPGALRILMDSMTTTMHRGDRLQRRTRLHLIVIGLLFLCLIVASVWSVGGGSPYHLGSVLGFYGLLIVTAGAAYADFVQSLVLSGLAGLAGGTLIHRPYDAGLLGAAAFAGLQAAIYTSAFAAVVLLLPLLYTLLPLDDMGLAMIGVIIAGLTLLALREIVVAALWRWVLRRAEANPVEVA